MTRRTGIILAYDKSEYTTEDEELMVALKPHIDLVKIGLEAMTAFDDDCDNVAELVASSVSDHAGIGGIMWDAKLHDIGNTVERAIHNILSGRPSIKMLTVHAAMSDGALRLAANACAEANVLPLAVTVLTDIDEAECLHRFNKPSKEVVLELAVNAARWAIGGLVCSPEDLKTLQEKSVTRSMIKVVPGIRPAWAAANDQKRVMTPAQAAKAGADYIVVGRPILQPPDGMTSLEAAKRIRAELDEALTPA